MITRGAGSPHDVGSDPAWQGRFYFNWADPEHRTFGLARIGYRFASRRTDGLVVSLRDGRLECFYGPANLPHSGPCEREDPAQGLRARRLLVQMRDPLRRWHLQIDGPRGMDLRFEATTPAFDYRGEGRRLAADMTGAHFEQAGRVSGWTRFGGSHHEIRAFGQRDKSWGVRDWARLEGWNWIAGQFAEDLSFNLMQTFEDGRALDNGFVYRDGEHRAIESARIDYQWGRSPHRMQSASIELFEADGRCHRIRAQALAAAPILRGGVWLEETHVVFRMERSGGERIGQGVVEHVWRPGAAGILRRAGRLLPVLRRFER